jgi:hypothetical protein
MRNQEMTSRAIVPEASAAAAAGATVPLKIAPPAPPAPLAPPATVATAEHSAVQQVRDVPAVIDAPPTYQVDLTVEPSTAWITLDLKSAGTGHLRRTLPVDGTEHEIRVGAPGYKLRTVRFKDAPPQGPILLEKYNPALAAPAVAAIKKPAAPLPLVQPLSTPAPVNKRPPPLSGTNGVLILR